MVWGLRIELIVKVVDQSHYGPFFFIFAEFSGVGSHASLNGQTMPPQALAPGVFTQKIPCLIAVHTTSLKLPHILQQGWLQSCARTWRRSTSSGGGPGWMSKGSLAGVSDLECQLLKFGSASTSSKHLAHAGRRKFFRQAREVPAALK